MVRRVAENHSQIIQLNNFDKVIIQMPNRI